MTAPERIRWTVEMLAIEPGERLLEVGCGSGVAAALVCERLVDGRLLAIDRSAAQIERGRRRNQAHLESGVLSLEAAELRTLDGADHSFDTVFAINVNLFWVGPATQELEVVRLALARGGRLVLVYQTPTARRARETLERLAAVLVSERFAPPDVRTASPTLFSCTTRAA